MTHDTTMVVYYVYLCHLDGLDIDLPILSLTGLSSSEPWPPCAPVAPLHLFTTWKHFFEQLQAFKRHRKILRSLNRSNVTFNNQVFSFGLFLHFPPLEEKTPLSQPQPWNLRDPKNSIYSFPK